MKLTAHEERRVAVFSASDPRSVRRFLRGDPIRSTTRARISHALAELGIEVPSRDAVPAPPHPQNETKPEDIVARREFERSITVQGEAQIQVQRSVGDAVLDAARRADEEEIGLPPSPKRQHS